MNTVGQVDLLLFAKLLLIGVTDSVPSGCDIPLYLTTQLKENEKPVLATARRLVQEGVLSRIVLFDDTCGGTAYSGADVWTAALPPSARITRIIGTSKLNTSSELVSLMEMAKKEKWMNVVLVATPVHMVRVMQTAVSAMRKVGVSGLRIYLQATEAQPWFEEGSQSQLGVERVTNRIDLLGNEAWKTSEYQGLKYGDGTLLPLPDVLEYFRWRDTTDE